MEKYTIIDKVGEGQYGDVFAATVVGTGELVALKRIRVIGVDGIAFPALREIKLLQELHQDNIVGLLDTFVHHQNVHLVLEFMETDLSKVIRSPSIVLTPPDIKAYMRMLLAGVAKLHECNVLHRDLKPEQLLLSRTKPLKIADFGLSRIVCSPERRYTNRVVTLWYRAPELLYGACTYGPGIDMWAVGCIFYELMRREALFDGQSEIDQLSRIFSIVGSPTEETWPGVTSLPGYIAFEVARPVPLTDLVRAASAEAVDLLGRMLTLDPVARISAAAALKHAFFTRGPPDTPLADLPLPPATGLPQPGAARAAMTIYSSSSDDDGDPVLREEKRAARKRRREEAQGMTVDQESESPPKRVKALQQTSQTTRRNDDSDDGDAAGASDAVLPRRALAFE